MIQDSWPVAYIHRTHAGSFMKSLLTILSFLVVASYANAAQLEITAEVNDAGLAKVKRLFKQTGASFEHDHLSLVSHQAKILSRKTTEKSEKTVKQLLYVIYSEWSRPDEVEVTTAKDASEIRAVLASSVSALEESEKADLAPASYFIREALKTLSSPKYKVFSHNASNSFGGCAGAAIESVVTKEILILCSCYSE